MRKHGDMLNWQGFSFLVVCKITVYLIIESILDSMTHGNSTCSVVLCEDEMG